MIDKQLQAIFRCPKDHAPLDLADGPLLAAVNRAIAGGRVTNSGGQSVKTPLEGGLVRRDRKILYPVVDDIPVLLVEEGIPLGQLEL